MIKVWRVRYNQTDCEGNPNGGGRIIGVFPTESEAKTNSFAKGDFKSDGIVEPLYLDGEKFLYKLVDGPVALGLYEDPAVIRKRALDKLTPEERRVLGV